MKEMKIEQKDIVLSCYPSGKIGTNQTTAKTPPNNRVGLISEGQTEKKAWLKKKKKGLDQMNWQYWITK